MKTYIITFIVLLALSQGVYARGWGGGGDFGRASGLGDADYSDMRNAYDRNGDNFGRDAAFYRAGENDEDGGYGGGGGYVPVPFTDSVDQENNSIFQYDMTH
jgi:hypothetical protein